MTRASLPDAWRRPEPLVTLALVLASTAALAWQCAWLAVPLVDDAAISIAFGRTFFEGHGFRATPWSQPVEAFSNPLWTLLTGLSVPLHLDPERFTGALGVALGAAALLVLAAWGPWAEGRAPRLEDALAPAAAAASPTYAYWVASGMETGLQAFLTLLAGGLLLRALRRGAGAGAGWALGLLCLTRPEGVLYAGAAGVTWLAWRRVRPGRHELGLALGVALPLLAWLAVRVAYFADVLPNTYYAKLGWDFDARAYLEGFARSYPLLVPLALAGGLLALGGPTRRRAALALAFLACGVYFAWRSKGDWMREWRFLAPLVPLLGALLAAGASALRGAGAPGWGRAAAAALLVLALGHEGLARADGVKAAPELPYRFVAAQFARVREEARALGQVRPLLGYPDLGGQALLLREAEVLDVAGLADWALAHHAHARAAQEDYLLSEGPPVLLDAHGPSGHLRDMPKLMARYRPHAGPVLRLKGLTRDEDPRCPEGKARALAQPLVPALERDLAQGRADTALSRWRCALAYLPSERLPSPSERRRLARQADAAGDVLLARHEPRGALRHFSLATLLDFGDAHRRRKAESLRGRLFSTPAGP